MVSISSEVDGEGVVVGGGGEVDGEGLVGGGTQSI